MRTPSPIGRGGCGFWSVWSAFCLAWSCWCCPWRRLSLLVLLIGASVIVSGVTDLAAGLRGARRSCVGVWVGVARVAAGVWFWRGRPQHSTVGPRRGCRLDREWRFRRRERLRAWLARRAPGGDLRHALDSETESQDQLTFQRQASAAVDTGSVTVPSSRPTTTGRAGTAGARRRGPPGPRIPPARHSPAGCRRARPCRCQRPRPACSPQDSAAG